MITLSSPLTITPAPVNGKAIKPITLTNIDYSIIYDNTQQQAIARIKGVNVNLVLWDQSTTPPYSSIGQFTDSDTDKRVSELLGSDIAAGILSLFPFGSKVKKP